MCERLYVKFVLFIYIFTQFETYNALEVVAESSSINDDDSMSHASSKDENRKKNFANVYLSSAIRRGIEKILSKNPNHKRGVKREELVSKIEQLLYYHQNAGIAAGKNKPWTINLTVKKPEDTISYKRKAVDVLNRLKQKADVVPVDKPGKRKSDIGNKEGIAEEEIIQTATNGNPSKSARRGIFTRQKPKPFEGYMKKLAYDVNGVMSDAKYMLRDTGKLIHGLKRVVKGASTLTSFANNAVRYTKYFSTEPNNVTIDYLEEKAIIALLEAQKAANESQKAANLAKIASAKAVDAEKRIEEGEYQDLKSVMPFVAATGILAEKAEKAARLARIEKQKTEKDFILMNKELGKMSEKMNEDANKKDTQDVSEEVTSPHREGYFNIKNPDENYFYMKQKQLEKDLSGDTETLPKPTHSVDTKSQSKSPNLDKEDEEKDQDLQNLARLTTKIAHLTKDDYDGKKLPETVAAKIARKLVPLLAKAKSIDVSSVNDLIGSTSKETNGNLYEDAERVVDSGIGGKQIADGSNIGIEKESVGVNNAFEKDTEKYATEQVGANTNSTSSENEVLTRNSAGGKHSDDADGSLEDSNNESAPVNNVGSVKEDATAGSSSSEKDNTAANNMASETEGITKSNVNNGKENVKGNTIDSERGGTSNSADSDKQGMDANSSGKETFGVGIPVSLKGVATTSSTHSKKEAGTVSNVGSEKGVVTTGSTGTEKEAGTAANLGKEKEAVTTGSAGTEKEAGTASNVGSEKEVTKGSAVTEKEDGSATNLGTEKEAVTTGSAGTEKEAGTASNISTEKESVTGTEKEAGTTINAGIEKEAVTATNADSEKEASTAAGSEKEDSAKTNAGSEKEASTEAGSAKGDSTTSNVGSEKESSTAAGSAKGETTTSKAGSKKEDAATSNASSEEEDSTTSNAGSENEFAMATNSGSVIGDATATTPGSEKESVVSEKANLNANTIDAEQEGVADNNSVSEKLGINTSSADVEKESVKTNTADTGKEGLKDISGSKGKIITSGSRVVNGSISKRNDGSENVAGEVVKPLASENVKPSTVLKLEPTKHILSSRKNYVSTHLAASRGKINYVNPVRAKWKIKSIQLQATRALHGRKKNEKRKNAPQGVKLKKQASPRSTAVKSIKHAMEIPTAAKTVKDYMGLPSQGLKRKHLVSAKSTAVKSTKHGIELPTAVKSIKHDMELPTAVKSIKHDMELPTAVKSTKHDMGLPTAVKSAKHYMELATAVKTVKDYMGLASQESKRKYLVSSKSTAVKSTKHDIELPTAVKSTKHDMELLTAVKSTKHDIELPTAVKSTKHDMGLPAAVKTIQDEVELPSQGLKGKYQIYSSIKHDLELPKRVSKLLFTNADRDVSNDESTMLLNYLDMDDSDDVSDTTESGDSSGDATIASTENKEFSEDKIRDEEMMHKNKKESVSKGKAHESKLPIDNEMLDSVNAISKNSIPSDLPLDINKSPINIPIDIDEMPTLSIETKSKESDLHDKYKGLELATLPDRPSYRKKHDIEKTYEFLDPFGFTKLEAPKKEFNSPRNYVQEYYNYKRRERTDIPVPDSHVIERER